ncbi:hypothetical protein ACGTJS_08155 [Faucicola mancuniensis]|uniref:hypothetical protein n=1 Tax=Faucicola mancuniensis TaxID=1309795 RepID=UPI0028F03648|nr:hypothetical protein [uncultured Moraxella sp.]
MQVLTSDFNYQEFEPNVQQFVPMIEKLSANERFALVKLIMNMPFLTIEKQSEQETPKKLAPLDVKLFDTVYVSDDFNN